MTGDRLTWFKSSYSGGSGDDCLEVALVWRKSTYSSGGDGECVEIAPCTTAVHVRDSKRPHDGQLALAAGGLDSFRVRPFLQLTSCTPAGGPAPRRS